MNIYFPRKQKLTIILNHETTSISGFSKLPLHLTGTPRTPEKGSKGHISAAVGFRKRNWLQAMLAHSEADEESIGMAIEQQPPLI